MKTEAPTRADSTSSTVYEVVETAAGGGGQGTRVGDPPLGPQGGSDIPGDPPGDFRILSEMLDRIQKTLGGLVNLNPPLIEPAFQKILADNWKTAETYFELMTGRLKLESETPIGKYLQTELYLRLSNVGMTGNMLKMKRSSLDLHLNRVDAQIFGDVQAQSSWTDKAIVGLIRWVKPAMTIMNSIVGSLVKELPGGEIIKEMKEHTEAAYESADALREAREEGESDE